MKMKMPKMFCLLLQFISFYLLAFADAAQGRTFDVVIVQEENLEFLHTLSGNHLPIAVPVRNSDLSEVAGSVLKAESWLRNHVLPHYPSTQITTILVGGNTCLCPTDQDQNFGILVPSLKNLHHSLQRWGLEKDIKLSVAFCFECLDVFPETILKSLLEFFCHTNSTYSLFAPPRFLTLSSVESESAVLGSTMKKFESFGLKRFNLVLSLRKPGGRKLLSMADFKFEIAPSSSIHIPQYPPAPSPSFPAVASTPPAFPAASPESSEVPAFVPSLSPHGPSLPPCIPVIHHPAPPLPATTEMLWCVAKPNVPEETLQEAMEYACGEGGADCEEIKPNGICFFPDTMVAHASYAFNSYWQKVKRNGGTCTFGGTAMLINSDPSFHNCRFVLV